MKKVSLALLSILMCVTMVLSFAACSEEEAANDIVGTWKGSAPIGDPYSVGSNINATYIFTFNDDGSVKLNVDENALSSELISYCKAYAAKLGTTYEQMLADEGVTEADLITTMKSSLTESLSNLGNTTYEFDGSNLTMKSDGGSNTIPAQLKGDTLSFEFNGANLTLTKQ